MSKQSNYTDQELLERIKSFQTQVQDQAFSQLYRDHYKSIIAMVTKNNGSAEDASDVFQDAIVVLHKNALKTGFSLNCKIGTYLYSVARNVWLKKLKKNKRITSISETEKEFIPISEDNTKILDKMEEKNLLYKHLQQMGEDCRKVLKFFYFDGMRLDEIATQMGYKSAEVAKNKKFRCFQTLKKSLLLDKNFDR